MKNMAKKTDMVDSVIANKNLFDKKIQVSPSITGNWR